MKRFLISAFVLSIALTACKNNDNPDPLPAHTVSDYFPLAVGNMWVFDVSSCDSTWTDCTYLRTDTNHITKDTLINAHIYYKIEGGDLINPKPVFIRDSLDYLIDSEGNILFSDKDFETRLSEEYIISNTDTLFHWYTQMQEDEVSIQVPMGSFNCLDNQLSFFRWKENFETEFNGHSCYSEGIGPVYQSALLASNTGGFKRELLSYELLIINK